MDARTARKILIVEPDLAAGMAYFRAFAVAGFHVEHVTSGAKALAALDRVKPDAVAMNLLLRENQASSILEAIRSRPKMRSLPVVVFARESAAYLFGKAKSEGATECVVVAPGSSGDLVSAVQRQMPSSVKSEATVPQSPPSTPAATVPRPAPAAPLHEPKPTPPALEPAARPPAPSKPAPPKPAPSSERPGQATELIEQLIGLSRNMFGTEDSGNLQPLLFEMHESAQLVADDAVALQSAFATSLCQTFLALLKDLSENSQRITPSAVRTIYQAVNSLEALLRHLSFSTDQTEPELRVLTVDDEPGVRQVVQLALGAAGLKSDGAQDAEEALALAKQNRYNLFVLDVNMPGLSGFELCQKLRASPLYRRTPVLFLTGSDNFESRVRSAGSGADDFIGKPFLPKELTVKALIHLLPQRMGTNPR